MRKNIEYVIFEQYPIVSNFSVLVLIETMNLWIAVAVGNTGLSPAVILYAMN